jgi:hypothetical protein
VILPHVPPPPPPPEPVNIIGVVAVKYVIIALVGVELPSGNEEAPEYVTPAPFTKVTTPAPMLIKTISELIVSCSILKSIAVGELK